MILEEGKYYVVREETQVRGPMRRNLRFSKAQWTDGIYHWHDNGQSLMIHNHWRDLIREATDEEKQWAITRSWLQ